ncbi:MAG: DsbA family protein [Candidatus Mariimomonas ferrooxydans]
MYKKRSFIVLVLLMLSLLLTGCADKEKIDSIDQTLKDIHATLKNVEAKLDKLPKTAAALQRPAVDYNKVYNMPVGTSAIKGNKNAPITVVEFSDFQCPYCARFAPTINEVLKAYPNEVKFVYKDFPLSFHKQAKNAAKAARAAGEQGKFWEMHDLIFEKYSTVNEVMFKEFATKLNLDMNKFLADFNSNKYDNLIQQDINLGRQAGVTGTPTLYMNGKRMQRRSFDDFKQAIDAILNQKKAG